MEGATAAEHASRAADGPSADRIHKSSVSSSSNSPAGSSLNPRSCVTCRKRKVKCDKKHPCSNCTKQRIECIFPGPGRAPRKPRKPVDGELLERVRRLESVVKSFGGDADDVPELPKEREACAGSDSSPSGPSENKPTPEEEEKEEVYQKWKHKVAKFRSLDGGLERGREMSNLQNRFGRLVVDEGKSRYVNNSFWASLGEEVEDLKAILNEDSDDSENELASPQSSHNSISHDSFIFGFSSNNVNMLELHPPAAQIPAYWQLYKENCDPLMKVLHIPTMGPKILEAKEHLNSIPRGLEALLFGMYYATATSLNPEECIHMFGEPRDALLRRYRFGIEQALARAGFLQSNEIIVLQAFVIFLMALRRNSDARMIWTLTGLVVRMAQTLGLHRDGTHFDLPPFIIELRRRLWWNVCILDARASEDHGCDPTIVEQIFDTQMPLNVNDSDLEPSMDRLPEPRVGCTEMTFCLIRFEVSWVFRRLQYVPPGPEKCNKFFANIGVEQKEQWITECHQRLEERYLKNCDMSVPLYWVIAAVSRLVMSKMWLVLYHPLHRQEGARPFPQEVRDKLWVTSIENIEYATLLETEPRTRRWAWLFKTYTQWHAIAFVLTELCERTRGPTVERAWKAIEAAAELDKDKSTTKHDNINRNNLWRPLRKLMAKARAERQKAIEEDRRIMANQPPMTVFEEVMDVLGSANVDHMEQNTSPNNEQPVKSYTPQALRNMLSPPPQGIQQEALAATTAQSNQLANEAMGLDQQPMDASLDGVDWMLKDLSPNNDSPNVLGEDGLNWANWDDMVREFTMDVDPNQPQGQGQTPMSLNYGYTGQLGFQTWY